MSSATTDPRVVSDGADLVRAVPTCDLVVVDHWRGQGLADTLRRYHAAGCSYVGLTVMGGDDSLPLRTIEELGAYRRVIQSRPDAWTLATSIDDIRSAHRAGRMAIGLHFQGTFPLGRNLDLVDVYHALGVRWMLLAYNFQNDVGGGCMEDPDPGLSRFGRAVVEQMNRVGMIVDLTHCGIRTSLEAIEHSETPPMFSHSGAHTAFPHRRNITDEQIQAVAARDGIVGIHGVGPFLNADQDVSAAGLFAHIDHVAQLVGPRHVALGLDLLDACLPALYAAHERDPDHMGMGVDPPFQFAGPEVFPDLVDVLAAHGYERDDIVGILGENFLRVLEANETPHPGDTT